MVFPFTQLQRLNIKHFPPFCKNKAKGKTDAVIYHQYTDNNRSILSRIKNSNNYTTLSYQFKSELMPRFLCLKKKAKKNLNIIQEETLSANMESPTLFSHTTDCLTPKSQQTLTTSVGMDSGDNLKLPSLLITNKSRTSSMIAQAPTTNTHHQHRNPRVIKSALKRSFLPYKTYYELEWPSDHFSSMMWLQLDKQMSSGIERVRQLGFANLDVYLDDGLIKYIKDSRLIDKNAESILIEILFISGKSDNGHLRKDSVLQTSSNDKKEAANVRLLRLRRVHWWTKNYNLARVYHV